MLPTKRATACHCRPRSGKRQVDPPVGSGPWPPTAIQSCTRDHRIDGREYSRRGWRSLRAPQTVASSPPGLEDTPQGEKPRPEPFVHNHSAQQTLGSLVESRSREVAPEVQSALLE